MCIIGKGKRAITSLHHHPASLLYFRILDALHCQPTTSLVETNRICRRQEKPQQACLHSLMLLMMTPSYSHSCKTPTSVNIRRISCPSSGITLQQYLSAGMTAQRTYTQIFSVSSSMYPNLWLAGSSDLLGCRNMGDMPTAVAIAFNTLKWNKINQRAWWKQLILGVVSAARGCDDPLLWGNLRVDCSGAAISRKVDGLRLEHWGDLWWSGVTGGRPPFTWGVNWEFFESFLLIYSGIAQGANWGQFQKLPTTSLSIYPLGKLRNYSEKTLQYIL